MTDSIQQPNEVPTDQVQEELFDNVQPQTPGSAEVYMEEFYENLEEYRLQHEEYRPQSPEFEDRIEEDTIARRGLVPLNHGSEESNAQNVNGNPGEDNHQRETFAEEVIAECHLILGHLLDLPLHELEHFDVPSVELHTLRQNYDDLLAIEFHDFDVNWLSFFYAHADILFNLQITFMLHGILVDV